jgi:hypothetical protein
MSLEVLTLNDTATAAPYTLRKLLGEDLGSNGYLSVP